MTLPDGVQLKLDRARIHLADLKGGSEAYCKRNRLRIQERGDETGPLEYVVTDVAPVPLGLGLALGDALHNARSALDHLAARLVEHEGGPGDEAYFPIASPGVKFDERTGEPVGWGKRIRDALPSALRARSAIRGLRCFPSGNDALVALHALDIADKHRILLPVVARMGHTLINLGAPPDGFIRQRFTQIEGGVVIDTVRAEDRADPAMRLAVVYDFDLAFNPEHSMLMPFADQPAHLVRTTTHLIDHVEEVALEVAPLLNM